MDSLLFTPESDAAGLNPFEKAQDGYAVVSGRGAIR